MLTTDQWALRYAPHVGYVPPDRLLFRAHAGENRADHVRFAARHGMAGILYPWAGDSPPEERIAVAAALRETGLCCSCVVTSSWSAIMDPIWVAAGSTARLRALDNVRSALRMAKELGSSTLAVLIRSDGATARSVQLGTALDRLREAADEVAKDNMVLAVEPMIELPDMLLRNFEEGVELVRAAAHPAVKLIFDTGHLTQMGDPLVKSYSDAYDDIALLQLADMPGRIEPGAGSLEITELLTHALRRGYGGLVDLEHHWSQPGEEGEQRGLRLLHDLDRRARRAAGLEVVGSLP
jgi:hydroxypyruvate isomerase